MHSPKTPKIEPAPTRDTAADALAAQDDAARKRSASLQGMRSTMLSGPGGVTSELTGTRTLTR